MDQNGKGDIPAGLVTIVAVAGLLLAGGLLLGLSITLLLILLAITALVTVAVFVLS